jgi:hypothetical protein
VIVEIAHHNSASKVLCIYSRAPGPQEVLASVCIPDTGDAQELIAAARTLYEEGVREGRRQVTYAVRQALCPADQTNERQVP